MGPTRGLNPNGILICSAILQGPLVCHTGSRPTDRPGYSVGNNRPHLRSAALCSAHPTMDGSSYSPGGANVHSHITHASLGLSESLTQTASRSVQPFCTARGRVSLGIPAGSSVFYFNAEWSMVGFRITVHRRDTSSTLYYDDAIDRVK